MNTITTMDDADQVLMDNPGEELALIRQQRGFSIEYVAGKLHLRVRIIELIEKGDFDLLPEPVFVKGYLRAYSKLLGVSPDPFLKTFNDRFTVEKKLERTLWQSKKESHKAERVIRSITVLFALGVMVAVSIWWQKNREVQQNDAAKEVEVSKIVPVNKLENEVKINELTQMEALFEPKNQISLMEKKGD